MTVWLDGKSIAAAIKDEVAAEVARLIGSGGRSPSLSVILVGDNPASHLYVRTKRKACEQAGIVSTLLHLPASVLEAQLLDAISVRNRDESVDGILVQLPLPPHIDRQKVFAAIRPDKDVDGFHPENVGHSSMGLGGFKPCTPRGIMELLSRYGISCEGREAVVVGRSHIVGRPTSWLLTAANATVTSCHSKTVSLESHVRRAEILVVAAGRPGLIPGAWVREGAVVVDVGQNRLPGGRLVGDVELHEAARRAAFITPVPGGVGPMTVAMLLKNTVECYRARSAVESSRTRSGQCLL
jgi:methylenetetrahydrofolate dehydrogenase (NADP+)/methenyltetrahydrofolate cyclohydrolase